MGIFACNAVAQLLSDWVFSRMLICFTLGHSADFVHRVLTLYILVVNNIHPTASKQCMDNGKVLTPDI